MWTIDAQCPRCCKKTKCKDRPEAIRTLSALTHMLNTEEGYVEGPGDGVLILACKDFAVA